MPRTNPLIMDEAKKLPSAC